MGKSKQRNKHAIDEVSLPDEAFPMFPDMSLAMQAMSRMNQENLKYVRDFNAEYADFMSRRMKEDFALPGRIAQCKSPVEVWQVYAEFLQNAGGQYQEEFARLARMAHDASDEIVHCVEADHEKDGSRKKSEQRGV